MITMKLCFLADCRSIHTKRWLQFFAANNEVHLISLKYPETDITGVSLTDFEELNIKVHFLPREIPGILFNSWKLKKLLHEIQPDILHAHFATHYGYWGACSGYHPFVVSAWGDDVLIHPKKIVLSRFVLKALNSADIITCDGENSRKAMLDMGIKNRKILLIFHGVNTQQFSPAQRSDTLMKDLFGNSYPVVICIRGFNPIYNIETLIQAIPMVISKIPNVNFLITGTGYNENELKETAAQLNVSSFIRFVGVITHEKLPKYLASADIYVSTSLSDGGVAVSTFEAMASGISPVVTDVGDNSQWIKSGCNGVIIPTRRSDLLANAIVQLLNDETLRSKITCFNRRLVEEKLDYYREMNKVDRVYHQLVNEELIQ